MSKFWGLTVNAGKKFKQQVQESFCISGAALEPLDLSSGKYDEKPVFLYLQHDQTNYLLCSISPKQSVLQTSLNIRIRSGETVGFHLKGGSPKSKVHLIGYTLPRGVDGSSSSSSPATTLNKGRQRSILVTKPKSADRQKKRVIFAAAAVYGPIKPLSKGGVLANDVKIGDGQEAQPGKMVTVYYEGRLKSNNKPFDATQNGPGFKFQLGKGDVVKGMDLGICGMKIGGKRRLVIPAELAYGRRGAPPDIPPDSTLIFDVELKNVS